MTKRNIILLFVALVLTNVVVSGLMVGGSIWYLTNTGSFNINQVLNKMSFEEQQPPLAEIPTFHSLEKLVLGVKGKRQTHYVMLELAIETRRPESLAKIDDYMPVIRNALLRMFSDKSYEQLLKQDEIDSLQNEVKNTLLTAFSDTAFVGDIDDVILTKYVIQ